MSHINNETKKKVNCNHFANSGIPKNGHHHHHLQSPSWRSLPINNMSQLADNDLNGKESSLISGSQPQGEQIVKQHFVSSKVNVTLSCEPEEILVNLNFTSPFKGVIQSGDKNTSCRIRGDGKRTYVLKVPHNSCGTKHVVSSGSFFNTLFIRYHPSLEMEGDQLKTIVCKFATESVFIG
ncbi:uncharacterized protein LOC128392361 isoform X2 [Panonychus citri]|uniref:uncharacterized protein LOC128392361 isoform X2 n=1 Tax=Panonychus citri TaxID=50023 RepID=UPI0023082C05|nr:uncharacterized protein LOC128392361 isoform X2 [Panonychus citri]